MTVRLPASPPVSPIIWEDGAPRSALYGDIYFSLQDGLAESRVVFLQGCGLPDAWVCRTQFTVAELGFGTGLNIAALLDLWQRTRPKGARLNVFSVEAHPIPQDDAQRALAAWPELSGPAQALLTAWPGRRRGRHRIDLPDFDAIVDVAVMDVAEALEHWEGTADAWFLDGFSPAANPAMWRGEVLGLVAAHSGPGARCATFTVAGEVRRGLQAAGFAVEKRPGHGRKRERLEARLAGDPRDAAVHPSVVIIGGGIAAASLARAFRALGVGARVIADPNDAAASSNPAALVTPALDAGGGPRAAFYADAFARAARLYRQIPDAVISTGALQIEADPRDEARFDAVAAQDIFEPGAVERLSAVDIGQALAEPALAAGLAFKDALVVEPAKVLAAWLPAEAEPGRVTALVRHGDGWQIDLADGAPAIAADAVVIAAGWGAAALAPDLGLLPVRGQASWAAGPLSGPASAFGAYAVPTRDGVLFGATHDRGRTDTALDPADHQRNLAALTARRTNLAKALGGLVIEGRAAIRAATPDRMPAAGAIAPGLFVLAGLGSRGFTTAPLLAEHVAALCLGAPSPLGRDLARLVDPARA